MNPPSPDPPRICAKVYCKAVLPPLSEHWQKCCQKCLDLAKRQSATACKCKRKNKENDSPFHPLPQPAATNAMTESFLACNVTSLRGSSGEKMGGSAVANAGSNESDESDD